jgi:DNA repair protein RecO (recombination protein O)
MGDEFRVKGIVISSIDYKEKDKLITIYTLELGKITANLKGVKNANAKLKFASQIFCFADFVLSKTGEFYTVITADQIESFFNLTKDYDKFLIGEILLEIVNIVCLSNEINEGYFLTLLKCLKIITYENFNNYIVLIKFLLHTFKISGYDINFDACFSCRSLLLDSIYFNFDDGTINCKNCAGINSVELTKKEFAYLKIIHSSDFEKLSTIKADANELINLIMMLTKNFENKFNKKIRIIKNLLIK